MELRKYEGKKCRIVDTDGDEFIAIKVEYVWPDDNEECGGCEALIVDTEDGDFFQINGPDIQSIDILE